ncbi:hypothetical protein [Methylosinus sporium]
MDDRFYGPVFADQDLDDFLDFTRLDDIPYLDDDDIDADLSDLIQGGL